MERAKRELFSVEVTSSQHEVVLVLHGELDSWTQPLFATALTSITDGSDEIVLDLADLTFLDAGNIGLIHRARNLARLRGTDLVLRSASPHISRILELTGLGRDTSTEEEPAPGALPLPARAYQRAGASA